MIILIVIDKMMVTAYHQIRIIALSPPKFSPKIAPTAKNKPFTTQAQAPILDIF